MHLWLCLAPRSMGQQTTDRWLAQIAGDRALAPLRGGHHFLSFFFFFCRFLSFFMFSLVLLFPLYCCVHMFSFYSSFYFSFEREREREQRTEKATWGSFGHLANGCCYEPVRLARGVAAFSTPRLFSQMLVYILFVCFPYFFVEMTEVWAEVETLSEMFWGLKKRTFVFFFFFPFKLKSSKSKSLSVYRGKKTTRRPRKFQRPQSPDKCLFSSFFFSSSSPSLSCLFSLCPASRSNAFILYFSL